MEEFEQIVDGDVFARRYNRWNNDYIPRIADASGPSGAPKTSAIAPTHEAMTNRLFRCWNYHAEGERDVAPDAVADRLERGERADGEGRFGGNPFFEIYLTVGMGERQNIATERFIDDYAASLCAKGSEFKGGEYAWNEFNVRNRNFPEWWGDFYAYLTESTSEKGTRMETFEGRCCLKSWLRKALGRFLIPPKVRETPFGALPPSLRNGDETDFEETIFDRSGERVSSEKYERVFSRFLEALRLAQKTLTEDEWLRIVLYRVESLSNNRVAEIYNVSPALASRRRREAEEKLRKAILRKIEDDKLLRDNRELLFGALRNDLRRELFAFFADCGRA